MRPILICLAMFTAAATQAPARADWEYTHWGMTPEQVAAASSGKVKVLPKSERQSMGNDQSEIAAMGTFVSAGRPLSIGFEFDTTTNGLNCVLYNANGNDVALVKDTLIKQYGQTKENTFPGGYSMAWKAPEPVEFTVGERPLAAVVTHCRAGS